MADQTLLAIDPPRGANKAKCDEKGRLKLPASLVRYLASTGDSVVFITTTDRRTAGLYTSAAWRRMEELFRGGGGLDIETAQSIARVANHFGADSEVDPQGRVLIPTDLRRELGLENEWVWVQYLGGRFEIVSDALYRDALNVAMVDLPAKSVEFNTAFAKISETKQ